MLHQACFRQRGTQQDPFHKFPTLTPTNLIMKIFMFSITNQEQLISFRKKEFDMSNLRKYSDFQGMMKEMIIFQQNIRYVNNTYFRNHRLS